MDFIPGNSCFWIFQWINFKEHNVSNELHYILDFAVSWQLRIWSEFDFLKHMNQGPLKMAYAMFVSPTLFGNLAVSHNPCVSCYRSIFVQRKVLKNWLYHRPVITARNSWNAIVKDSQLISTLLFQWFIFLHKCNRQICQEADNRRTKRLKIASGPETCSQINITKLTPWFQFDTPSDRRLSAKLVPTFAYKCPVISTEDPYGSILGFLDWSHYHFYQLTPQLYSRGWVGPVPDPLLRR
jgi:hypothetical protein